MLAVTRLQLDERAKLLKETENAVLYMQKQQDAQWAAKAVANKAVAENMKSDQVYAGTTTIRQPFGALASNDQNLRQVTYRPVFFLFN